MTWLKYLSRNCTLAVIFCSKKQTFFQLWSFFSLFCTILYWLTFSQGFDFRVHDDSPETSFKTPFFELPIHTDIKKEAKIFNKDVNFINNIFRWGIRNHQFVLFKCGSYQK